MNQALTDRLFRHLAWANAEVFAALSHLPDAALALTLPGTDNTVADIAHHLASAAERYAARVAGETMPSEASVPRTAAELSLVAQKCALADAKLRQLANAPEQILTTTFEGRTVHRAASTILVQAVHHATEHRAQIAAALSANGSNAIDLDALDLWAFGDFEGRGE